MDNALRYWYGAKRDPFGCRFPLTWEGWLGGCNLDRVVPGRVNLAAAIDRWSMRVAGCIYSAQAFWRSESNAGEGEARELQLRFI
jgi:hypothetical protein